MGRLKEWASIGFYLGLVGVMFFASKWFVDWGYANGSSGMFAVGMVLGLGTGLLIGVIFGASSNDD